MQKKKTKNVKRGEEVMFDPKTHRYPFPKDTSAHYLKVRKDDGTVFDRNYPYVDLGRKMRVKRAGMRVLLHLAAFPVMRVRLGLRVRGREKLKEHRDLLEGGAVSVSNHVHLWDYLAILWTLRPNKPYVLTWDRNIRGENGKLMRPVGGVPIPEGDLHATAAMIRQVGTMLEKGGWLHIYGEGSMWEYYAPIRPLKDGFSYFALRYGKPVLPLAFSYREPGWIRKKIFRQIALFTLTVGDPVMPDMSLPREERARDLVVRTHAALCRLSGGDPETNIYPPVYDRSERIDYYP